MGKAAETGTLTEENRGSGGGAAVTDDVEQPSENGARDSSSPGNREGKGVLQDRESAPVVGNDGAGNQTAEDGGEEVAKEVSPEGEPAKGRGDGEVTLMYEMYDEKFPIKVNVFMQGMPGG